MCDWNVRDAGMYVMHVNIHTHIHTHSELEWLKKERSSDVDRVHIQYIHTYMHTDIHTHTHTE